MSKRPRMPYPKPLSGVMHESLASLGLSERLREAEIWSIWPDVVGSTLVDRAQPARIINGTLTVVVSSAPWMQELRFMTGMMKEKLNSRLGAEIVKEIVLKAGKIDLPALEVAEEPAPLRFLDPQQLSFIEEQSALIEDVETRLAFIELMKVSMQQQRKL